MPVSRHLVLATVSGFPDTHVAYPYCLCCYSKLLEDQNQDCWLCCKCGQSCQSDRVEWRYRLALTITEGDTIASVCLFGSMLDQFFGCTATQFKRYLLRLESSCDYSDQLLKRAVEQSFIGHSYYFGFKTTGAINRQGTNAPITLRQLVSHLEPRCQTSNESVSNIVAFQILPSTTTASQSTVLDLMHLYLRKKSLVPAERLSSETDAHMTRHQTFSPVQILEARNEASVVFHDTEKSGGDFNDWTRSSSFVSVCDSSFGQETALLSCDWSKSHNDISREALSQHQSTNICDQTATKGNSNKIQSQSRVLTEQLSSNNIVSSEKYIQDFLYMDPDKSTAYPSFLGVQDSSSSDQEFTKSRLQRLDSSGYNSLLKSSTSLEGNLKEFSAIEGCLSEGSWNKENMSDYKYGVESVKENDPFSGSLNNSAFLKACSDCTGMSTAAPLMSLDDVNRSSVKYVNSSSSGRKHVLVSRSSMDNVSCSSNEHAGDKIKDRFKQFTSVRNTCNKNRNKSRQKNDIIARTENTSDSIPKKGGFEAPVGKSATDFISRSDEDTMKEGKVPVLISDTKIENSNQNPTIAFPESEDMWAYLTDEEEFCNAAENTDMVTPHTVQSRGANCVIENVNISFRRPIAGQSKGDNHVTETENVDISQRTSNTVQSKGDNCISENENTAQVYKCSDEESSDETFEECFDPEFLNLVEQDSTDAEDNSDEMLSNPNKKVEIEMKDCNDGVDATETHDSDETYISDEDFDAGGQDSNKTHMSDEDADAVSNSSGEDVEAGSHNFDENVDAGTHNSDGDVDEGSQNSDVYVDAGTHVHLSDEVLQAVTQKSDVDVDEGSQNSDEDVDEVSHNFDKKRTHSSDEDVDAGTQVCDETQDFDETLNSDEAHSSDKDDDTDTCDSDNETGKVGRCNTDDKVYLTGTEDMDKNLHTAGVHGSDQGDENVDRFDIDEGTDKERCTDKEIYFTKSKTTSLTSPPVCTIKAAHSVSFQHPTDPKTKLNNPEFIVYQQEGVDLDPMPDSEDLCVFLDSTFGDITGEQCVNIPSHVLNDYDDVAGKSTDDDMAEKEGNSFNSAVKENNDINNGNEINGASENSDLENSNCESKMENVYMKNNFKDETQRNGPCLHILPSSDEAIEHLESMFDDSFDEVETQNEDQVLSKQESIHVKGSTQNSNSVENKIAQCLSRSSYQHHSETENVHPLQDKVDSVCGSNDNAVRFVPEIHVADPNHRADDSSHYQHHQHLQNQDLPSLPVTYSQGKPSTNVSSQLQNGQDITGQNILHKDNSEHHFNNENCPSQDQSCVSEGLPLSFNSSTDLFGCSENGSVALCNDTYSQSFTCNIGQSIPDKTKMEAVLSSIESPVKTKKQENEETGKTVQFARRLSCVKNIQLIDIEMKMRQNPRLKLPVIPKSCLKVQGVVSPHSPPCFKRDTLKGTTLSKVFSLRKQEKLESQDLFSCSTISENSCNVTNPNWTMPEGTEDVFSVDDAVIPGTQDLFTPSPVQMSDSMDSDFVLGTVSCNRLGKKLRFPTWTKKPSIVQTFVSTPLEGYSDKFGASRAEPSELVSPNLTQGNEDSFAQNSASLFLDSFEDLRVTNSNSGQGVKFPSSLENCSLRTTNLGIKRKDISPICVGVNNQTKGDNLIPTGEVTLDTVGTPDLFGTSNVSASSSGFRSDRKVQSLNSATNFTFPVKRLFLD